MGSTIVLLFSEKMNRRSVEGAFRLVPSADLESLHWEKNSLSMVPARGLMPERIYTLLLAAGMKDGRGNRTPQPAVIHFSTGDSLPPGRLEGKIVTGRLKPQGIMVWAFDSERCPETLGETSPEGVGQSDGKGEFSVGALPVGRSYCLYAHNDIDLDGEVDEGDLVAAADSVVSVESDAPIVSGLEIYLVADDEPGRIAGTVVDSARVMAGLVGSPADTLVPSIDSPHEDGDSGRAVRQSRGAFPDTAGGPSDPTTGIPDSRPGSAGLVPGRQDSAGVAAGSLDVVPDSAAAQPDTAAVIRDPAAVKAARAESVYSAAPVIVVAVDEADSANFVQGNADRGGAFTLSKVKPGTYRLEVFRDLDGDRSATPGFEPVAVVERVSVRPGRTTELGMLVLRWPEPMGEDELRERILEGKAME